MRPVLPSTSQAPSRNGRPPNRGIPLLEAGLVLTLAGCSARAGDVPPSTRAASGAAPSSAAKAEKLEGRWSALPPHGGGAVRAVAVAMAEAGVYLGITAEEGPRVLHARWEAGDLAWSAPWALPVPPPKPGVKHRASWPAYGNALAGVELTVDRLDPMRIAVNLIESQGGSFGIMVGHWNESFLHVVPPDHESDIRFARPMILRGPELFTHDTRSFWHFRLTGTVVDARDLVLDEAADELGWHADIDERGGEIALSAFDGVLVLKRTKNDAFELHRQTKLSGPMSALAMSKNGDTTVVLDQEHHLDVLTLDRQGHETARRTIPAPDVGEEAEPRRARHLAISGTRMAVWTHRGLYVVDLPTGRTVELVAPPADGSDRALVMHAERLVVATIEGVGVYTLTGAF